MPISNPFMDIQNRHVCNFFAVSSGKLPRSAMPIEKQNVFSYSPQSCLYQCRDPWSPVQAASVWRFTGHCWWERQGTTTQELFFLFPAYLCNTVGLSKTEVRRGWDMGVEKHGRKKTLQSENCRQEKWLKWGLWGTRQWVERQEKFLRTASENLCCKWNPKLNSFPSDKEWHRQFP